MFIRVDDIIALSTFSRLDRCTGKKYGTPGTYRRRSVLLDLNIVEILRGRPFIFKFENSRRIFNNNSVCSLLAFDILCTFVSLQIFIHFYIFIY